MPKPAEQIFISYSRKDARMADGVVDALVAAGLSVWIDRSSIGSGLWKAHVVAAINNCCRFVLLISPNSMRSDDVRAELDLAHQSRCSVLPVVIAEAEIPDTMKYQLAGIQQIHLSSGNKAAMAKILDAVGADLPALSQQPSRPWRSAVAGLMSVVLCGLTFLLLQHFEQPGLAPEIMASLISPLASQLWRPGFFLLLAAIAGFVALYLLGPISLHRSEAATSRSDTYSMTSAIAVYLLLAVPGTLALGLYVAAAAAFVAAIITYFALLRTGSSSVSIGTAVVLAVAPSVGVLTNAAHSAAFSSAVEQADLYLPEPCLATGGNRCAETIVSAEIGEEALQDLSDRIRETVENVFGGVRGFLQDDEVERAQAEQRAPLLKLASTVEIHHGCAERAGARDPRLFAFLMKPQLMLQDGRVLRVETPIGFSACQPEFELEALRAARLLLERIQSLDWDSVSGGVFSGRREFSEEEVHYIRRRIVLWWYVALKNRAIEAEHPPEEWAIQKGILNEKIEKERIRRVYPQIYLSEAFRMADFIWRSGQPEFTDDEVARILDTFPPAGTTDAIPEARVAFTRNLGSLSLGNTSGGDE